MKKMRMCFPNEKTFADGFAEYILDCKARNLRDGTTAFFHEVFFDCSSCNDPLGASVGFEEVFEMEQSNTDLYFSDVWHGLSPPWRLSAIVAYQEKREKPQITKFY